MRGMTRRFLLVAAMSALVGCAGKFRRYDGPGVTRVMVFKKARTMHLLNGKRILITAAGQGIGRYDALLQDYEPGETEAGLQAMFDALRPRLVALREGIAGAATQHAPLSG